MGSRIAVCEGWQMSEPFGGHQIEVSAYADLFRSFGHEVDLFVTHRPEEFAAEAGRRFPDLRSPVRPLSEIPPGYDLYWIGYPWLWLPPGVARERGIVFWIDPYVLPGALQGKRAWPIPRAAFPEMRLAPAWTHSSTMRRGLAACYGEWGGGQAARVFYAPLDYRSFRGASRPWGERKYDAAWMGRMSAEKRFDVAVEVLRRSQVRAVVISPEPLKVLLPENVDLILNPEPAEIPAILGDSRTLLSTSANECCSLAIFEALNAGCSVVATDVGSAREQAGEYGSYVPWDSSMLVEELETMLRFHLDEPVPVDGIVAWGEQFDRAHNVERIRAALEDALKIRGA
ncbi:MAG: hypothetical protein DDT40_01358 [candidate division WS2 bacterium]|nr:hypothetical protein [Candidatus Psychracetigena formicireducens]